MTLILALLRAGLISFDPVALARIAATVRRHGFRPSGIAACTAIRFPDQVAIDDDDGSVTYRELDQRVGRLAAAMRERHGVGEGCAVGVLCRNGRGFVEGLLAASTLSADAVLLNTEFPAPQLAQVLRDHAFACVVHDAEFAPVFDQAGYAGPRIQVGDALPEPAAPLALARKRGRIVILTSGTTGIPKGAPRNPGFGALHGPLTTLLTRIPLHTGTTMLVAPPLFHGFGLAYLVLALLLGATLVVRRRFDPDVALELVASRGVEILVAVPTMLRRLLDAPSRPLPSLKAVLSAGSPLGASLGQRFAAAFGPILYNLYGSSETGFGAMATPEDSAAAPGTVGYPPLGTELRLLGPDDREVPTGGLGRVFVRSGLVFSGYSGGGSKDVVDGFTSSGDVGRRDPDGRLFIEGRADDMIVSGGENVFPVEVEAVLESHPGVAEVAVTGVSDDEFGQRLEAFVVVRAGHPVDDEALRGFLKERIARYKVPRAFVFLPCLPRNATGKVLKRELRA